MHTGDNMLAIYASEKALRLAERLGEAAAASRAHGIFGRVFGRIGDSERARENLERSVELARESDPGEAVRALLTLGYHREVSEADYAGAGGRLPRGARARRARPATCPARSSSTARLGQLAVHRGDWEAVERAGRGVAATSPSARASTGKLCFPLPDARLARAGASGDLDERRGVAAPGRRARRAGRPLGGRLPGALRARRDASPARRPRRAPRPSWSAPSTSASGPGLVAQSIEAISARAVVLALAGRADAAAEAAEEAERLAERLRYPVGKAASLEARGRSPSATRQAAAAALGEARDAWLELGRPLDAARCDYLRGRRLLEIDPAAAREALRARRRRGGRARRQAPGRARPRLWRSRRLLASRHLGQRGADRERSARPPGARLDPQPAADPCRRARRHPQDRRQHDARCRSSPGS